MSFTQTLILNQQYQPHAIVDWKDAVTRMINGKVQVLVQYDEILAVLKKSSIKQFPGLQTALRGVVGTDVDYIELRVPAVALLTRAVRRVKSGVRFSKSNIYTRDNFKCQYCGVKFRMSELNYDHVVPRAQGGRTTWSNIVTSCYDCNGKKADRTPQEAGMPLLSIPTKPKTLPLDAPYIQASSAPDEWVPFIQGSQ